MNLNNGFIKLFRGIEDNPLWKIKPFDKARAWIDLLLLANHKPSEVLIKGEIVQCNRGEVLRSLTFYENRWGWSRQKVRSYLNLLEKMKMIQKKNSQITTHLTLCNYRQFQDSATQEQHGSNTGTTLYKNSKNVISNKNMINFDLFWIKYPKKIAKSKCLNLWKTKNLDSKIKDIMRGLNDYMTCDQWKKDQGAYIPNPHTFLYQERYLDQLTPDDTVLSAEDIKQKNIKKENQERQKIWEQNKKRASSPQQIKHILKGWNLTDKT